MLKRKISVVTDHPFAIEVDESIKAPKQSQWWRGRWGWWRGNSWRQWDWSRWWSSSRWKRPAVAKRKENAKRNRRG
jgi:hypothetical protein